MIKKIFALVLLLVLGKLSYAQYPITQTLGSDSTIVISKGALQSRLINVTYTDTTAANLQRIRQYPGAQIATTTGGLNLWIRNATATAWIPVATGSGNNIYTIDGTLLGNRTLTGAGYSLTFNQLSKLLFNADSTTINTDQATISNNGVSTLSVKGATGRMFLVDTTAPADERIYELKSSNGEFYISILNDAQTSNDSAFLITSASRVGINTLNPDSTLKVGGGVNILGGLRVGNLPTSPGTKQLRINAQGQFSVTDTLIDAGGTVTSVGTNNGSGITGGPITTTGTLAIDTTNVIATKASVSGGLAGKLNISDTAAMLAPYLRAVDTASLSNRINAKLNISDTATMLGNYLNNVGYGLSKVGQVASADSATLSAYYLRRKDSLTATNPLGYVTKKILSDTAAAIRSADAGGTVTSVGLTMPAAFAVAGSPITTSGTFAVTGAGLVSQYIRGDGTLANFPGGGGGGGSSVSYYLNGGTNQGTFVGNTYYEMSKTAVVGSAANFSIAADGYIAQFITDAGDPALLNIPGGNWNFEMYFNASSGGGTPSFYVELYKYDGTSFTLIASSSGSPEGITGGTAIDLYTTALAVPATSLTLTDRLAVRVYVTHSGRTITLHTQDNTLCQIITTFTTGITAINSLTAQVQYLTTGTSGTDFNISSLTDTHTFNLPVASGTNTGKLSNTDWTTFNNKIGPSDTASMLANYITGPQNQSGPMARFSGNGTIDTSRIFQNNGLIGINTTLPFYSLDVLGTGRVTSNTYLATSSGVVGIGTTSADSLLTVEQGAWIKRGVRMSGLPSAPGTKALRIDANGTLSIADTLIDAGGTVTSVATNTGTGITGGTITTTGTLAIDTLLISTRAWRQKGIDSVAALINSNVSGTTNYVSKFTGTSTIGNSSIFDNGSNVGIGTASPASTPGYRTLSLNGTSGSILDFKTNGTSRYQIYGDATRLAIENLTGPGGIYLNQSNGYVGIATTGPDSLLTVNGSTHLKNAVRMSGLPTGTGTKSLRVDANGTVSLADTLANGISGSGTTNYIPKFTSSSAIGNSVIYESGGSIGIGTTSLDLVGSTTSLTIDQSSGNGQLSLAANGTVRGRIFADNSTSELRIGNPTANPVMFFTNNTERMRLDASGNLGINTSSPTYKLDVNGTGRFVSNANGLTLSASTGTSNTQYKVNNTSGDNYFGVAASDGSSLFTGTTAYAGYVGTNNAYPLQFATGGSVRATLDASGNLGLGVSPSAWGFITPLQIKNSTFAGYTTGTTHITYTASNWYLNGSGTDTYIANGAATLYSQASGQHAWYTAPSGTAGNAISFTQAMTLDASGNLAIGNTSASGKVHITGGSSGADLLFLNTSGATTKYAFKITGAATDYFTLRRNHPTGGDLDIMSWTYGGNVGIGTTSPNYLLDLQTTSTYVTNNLKVNASAAANNYAEIAFQLWSGAGSGENVFGGSGTSRPSAVIRALSEDNSAKGALLFATFNGGATNANLTEKMRITSGGQVGIGTSSPNTNSLLTISASTSVSSYWRATNANAATRDWSIITNNIDFGDLSIRQGNSQGADATAGTTRLYIKNDGNVGIGTTSPSAKLEVQDGQIRITGTTAQALYLYGAATVKPYITLNQFGVGDFHIAVGQSASNTLSLTKTLAGSDGIIINSSGNVGIGTTSPATLLHLQQSSGPTIRLVRTSNRFDITGDNDFMELNARDASTYMTFKTADTERMRITSGGRVGIGQTAPGTALSVAGQTESWQLALTSVTGTAGAIIGSPSANVLAFGDWGGTERMRITSGGELLINTTSDAGDYKLQVNGSQNLGSTSLGQTILNIVSSTTGVSDIFFSDNVDNRGVIRYDHTSDFMSLWTAGGERARITSGGELLIGTTSDAGAFKLQVDGDMFVTNGNTYTQMQFKDGTASGSTWSLLSGFPNLGDFTIREAGVQNSFILKKTTGNLELLGSIKTAAPSGGTAKPWKLGSAGVTLGGSNLSGVEVEINGTTYYLVTGYLPEPEPDPAALPASGPSGSYKTYNKPTPVKSAQDAKIQALERELAELKEMVKKLASK